MLASVEIPEHTWKKEKFRDHVLHQHQIYLVEQFAATTKSLILSFTDRTDDREHKLNQITNMEHKLNKITKLDYEYVQQTDKKGEEE